MLLDFTPTTAAAAVQAESLHRLEVARHLFARPVVKGTFEKKTALKDVFPFCQDTGRFLRRASIASITRDAWTNRCVPQAACHQNLLTTTAASVAPVTTLLQAPLRAPRVKLAVPMLLLAR